MVSSAYQRLLIFLPEILTSTCDSSSPAFHIMYSEYKLNKQSDCSQPCHTHFPIVNQSVIQCPVLTVASWPAYRFLRRQVRWPSTPINLRIFYSLLWFFTVKGFSIVNEAEIGSFSRIPLLSPWLMNVDSLICLLCPFETQLVHWNFSVQVPLKPTLKDFEITLLDCEVSTVMCILCASLNIVWHCPTLRLEWRLPFSSPVATAEFSKSADILSAALLKQDL